MIKHQATKSRDKGNAYERIVNKKLSLWISYGERKDLFARNTGSGGSYTLSIKRSDPIGIPGDALGMDARTIEFLSYCFLEYKHWDDLNLEASLWSDKGELRRVIDHITYLQAASRKNYILIAKADYRPEWFVSEREFGLALRKACFPDYDYHSLWNDATFVCKLDDMLKADPKSVVAFLKSYKTP